MGLARAVLVFSALAYGGIALGFLVAPAELAAVVSVSLLDATADNDVRAVYGGVALGITLFLVASLRRPAWLEPALAVVALTLGSMAFARFVSMLVIGLPGAIAYLLHGAEILGFALAVVALRRLPAKQTS